MSGPVLHPAEGVHLVFVEEDLVTLNLADDAYACLPELGGRLARDPRGGFVVEDAALADELVASGLFSFKPPTCSLTPIPSPPRRSSREARFDRGRSWEVAQFASSVLHAGRAFKGRGVSALIKAGGAERPARAGVSDPVRRAVLFDRWLPWAPDQGVCLYRAYTLRRFLWSGGQDACWVFGVRTWPFSAHCWLQAGDVLLDDDLDRVALYTPILAA